MWLSWWNQLARNLRALSAVAIAVATSTQAYGQTTELKLAHLFSPDSPQAEGLSVFADVVAGSSGGEIKIVVLPGSSVGSPVQLAAMLSEGGIDLSLNLTRTYQEFEPNLGVFYIPGIFDDIASARYFQVSEAGQALLAELAKDNIHALDYWHIGVTELFTTSRIRTPNDLKGLRVRMAGSDEGFSRVLSAMGATPVPLQFSEVYAALQTGVIDGYATTVPNAKRYSDSVQSVVNVPLTYESAILAANLETWNELSDEHKKIIEFASQKARRVTTDILLKQQSEALDGLVASGANVVDVSVSNDGSVSWADVWAEEAKRLGVDPRIVNVAASFGGTGGGNDPCRIDTCRCPDRSCSDSCCRD